MIPLVLREKYLILLIAFPFQSYCAYRQDQKTQFTESQTQPNLTTKEFKIFPI